jgi:hypothetical protein
MANMLGRLSQVVLEVLEEAQTAQDDVFDELDIQGP